MIILIENIKEQIENFDVTFRREQNVQRLNLLVEFKKKFPFKEDPSSIDQLTPDLLFKEGSRDSFFYWLQYRLKEIGHIFVGTKVPYEQAVAKIDTFRQLLKIAVDETKPIHEKIDAPWQDIAFFGGDKHIAKKIVYCYNSDRLTPIFKTEELEHFCQQMGIREDRIKDESFGKFGKEYDILSVGEKWEVLNMMLLSFKARITEMKSWDNYYFTRFLYHYLKKGIPPRATETTGRTITQFAPLNKWGLLFLPRNHEETLYLFAVLHREIGFPYLTLIQKEYPDVIAIDNKGQTKRIEIELYASQFDHDPLGCDYIVCWENDKEERPAKYPEIIALKDYL